MTLHVIGHVREALVSSRTELRSALRGPAARGSRWRLSIIALALVLGVGTATVLLPHATSWTPKSPPQCGWAGQSRRRQGCGLHRVLPSGGCVLNETARILDYLAAAGARQCGLCMFGLPAIAADMAALASADRHALGRLRRRLPVIDK